MSLTPPVAATEEFLRSAGNNPPDEVGEPGLGVADLDDNGTKNPYAGVTFQMRTGT